MISLSALARLASEHVEDLDLPVQPLVVAGRSYDTDVRPAVMGIVNLSLDSGYRDSVATTRERAVRRGRVLAAQGADFVDLGAESSDATTARVGAQAQIAALVPVIEDLAGHDIVVSLESYEAPVVRAGLEAGARIVNLTGTADDDAMFDLAAEFGASVVLSHILGDNVRDLDGSSAEADPVPAMLEQFERRIANARTRGVPGVAIDPGLGFEFPMAEGRDRAAHQSAVLLNSFRLRRLGVPVCHALPYAFALFGEQFRSAEAFFAVLAELGGTGLFRTHEVPAVVAVLDAMRRLDVGEQ